MYVMKDDHILTYFIGSKLSPESSCTTRVCLGLLSRCTFLFSSSEAFSISIGNLISCTGAGYLTANTPHSVYKPFEVFKLTSDGAAIRKNSRSGVLPGVSGPLYFGHSTSVGVQLS